jgi:hypothetical protein
MAIIALRFVDDGVPGDTLTNLYDDRNGLEAQVQTTGSGHGAPHMHMHVSRCVTVRDQRPPRRVSTPRQIAHPIVASP